MNEQTLKQNIFKTGRDPHEWIEEYVMYFGASGDGVAYFPEWFEKLKTGYNGIAIGKATDSTGTGKGKYAGFLNSVTDQLIPIDGMFSRPDIAARAIVKELRELIDLKVWLLEYVKANADKTGPLENNEFPRWWLARINPNWPEWAIFSEDNNWYFWLERDLVCRSGRQDGKAGIITDLVNFVWNEVETAKKLLKK